jgi:hypothetical protein
MQMGHDDEAKKVGLRHPSMCAETAQLIAVMSALTEGNGVCVLIREGWAMPLCSTQFKGVPADLAAAMLGAVVGGVAAIADDLLRTTIEALHATNPAVPKDEVQRVLTMIRDNAARIARDYVEGRAGNTTRLTQTMRVEPPPPSEGGAS